jgi:gluconolactonase
MRFFNPPTELVAEVFATIPPHLGKSGQPSTWIESNHPGSKLGCFLEGPAFDRNGNLYVVDIPFGRIFRITPDAQVSVAAEYDGWPNGLAVHRDGRLFITDYRLGLMTCDPATGKVEPWITHARSEGFKGVNDLVFASNGDLYFTDQGQTGVHDQTGRVWRATPERRLECLIDNGPSPNGIALSPDESAVYVAMTRTNCMWHLPLRDGVPSKCGVFGYLPGMHGPDGLAMDAQGNLAVGHARAGIVWLMSPAGEFLYGIRAPDGGGRLTNMAYGGPEGRHLYITDSYRGTILRCELPVPGMKLYSHQ